MPWKECSVMDERLRFVARLLDGEAMSEVCRAFGISRKTGYKIFDHIWQQSGADKKGKGRRGARFAPDSPLEGAVRSEPVSEGENSLLARKIQGNTSILAIHPPNSRRKQDVDQCLTVQIPYTMEQGINSAAAAN